MTMICLGHHLPAYSLPLLCPHLRPILYLTTTPLVLSVTPIAPDLPIKDAPSTTSSLLYASESGSDRKPTATLGQSPETVMPGVQGSEDDTIPCSPHPAPISAHCLLPSDASSPTSEGITYVSSSPASGRPGLLTTQASPSMKEVKNQQAVTVTLHHETTICQHCMVATLRLTGPTLCYTWWSFHKSSAESSRRYMRPWPAALTSSLWPWPLVRQTSIRTCHCPPQSILELNM